MTAMGRGLDKLLLGHGSADAGWWQVRIRSTGQRKDATVDPSTGQRSARSSAEIPTSLSTAACDMGGWVPSAMR
jgi:hypothetical protein